MSKRITEVEIMATSLSSNKQLTFGETKLNDLRKKLNCLLQNEGIDCEFPSLQMEFSERENDILTLSSQNKDEEEIKKRILARMMSTERDRHNSIDIKIHETAKFNDSMFPDDWNNNRDLGDHNERIIFHELRESLENGVNELRKDFKNITQDNEERDKYLYSQRSLIDSSSIETSNRDFSTSKRSRRNPTEYITLELVDSHRAPRNSSLIQIECYSSGKNKENITQKPNLPKKQKFEASDIYYGTFQERSSSSGTKEINLLPPSSRKHRELRPLFSMSRSELLSSGSKSSALQTPDSPKEAIPLSTESRLMKYYLDMDSPSPSTPSRFILNSLSKATLGTSPEPLPSSFNDTIFMRMDRALVESNRLLDE